MESGKIQQPFCQVGIFQHKHKPTGFDVGVTHLSRLYHCNKCSGRGIVRLLVQRETGNYLLFTFTDRAQTV